MSTLKVANLQNTGSGAPTVKNSSGTEVGHFAKAWVNFDGTTNTGGVCTINDSFNVTSVTDENTGRYFVNFTNNFANTNYCVSHGASFASGNGFFHFYDNEAVSGLQIAFIHTGGSYADPPHVSCVIHAVV